LNYCNLIVYEYFRDLFDQFSTIYVHTYIHLSPYFVGIILGYILFNKRKYRINAVSQTLFDIIKLLFLSLSKLYLFYEKFLNLVLWLISFISLLTIMLSTYSLNRGEKWSPFISSLFAGLHRSVWSVCIGWIIFSCASGNGGIHYLNLYSIICNVFYVCSNVWLNFILRSDKYIFVVEIIRSFGKIKFYDLFNAFLSNLG